MQTQNKIIARNFKAYSKLIKKSNKKKNLKQAKGKFINAIQSLPHKLPVMRGSSNDDFQQIKKYRSICVGEGGGYQWGTKGDICNTCNEDPI